MTFAIEDLFTRQTLEDVKARVIDIAVAAGLPVTSWVLGDPSERWIEIVSRAMDAFLNTYIAEAVRGFFLDQATDPGDVGNLAADQTPRKGWLSALGEAWFHTERRGQTFATGFATVTNVDTSPATFKPFDVTFQRSTAGSDGGYPTYRNDSSPSQYTNLDGSLTLAPSASVILPILADQIGTYANATSGQISVVVTNSFGLLTVTNANPVLGSERESAIDYRARCRTMGASLAPGGPEQAYVRAATTAKDGSPLQRHDGSGPVGITRTQAIVSAAANGTVTAYFADNDGPATTVDVESANANIQGLVLGEIIEPSGVVPDCVTYTGQAAVQVTIAMAGSVRIKAVPGIDSSALATAVKDAIVAKLAEEFSTFPIGGDDQVSGAGKIYTSDLLAIVDRAYPGTYKPTVTSPAGSETALAAGRVAVLDTEAADWTVTVV